ncbi:F-box domain containing protein [Trema orientale]|uniref:F-box domain containing protein n=1 Tax=Trema orientale TaxID=63057 RepID=A0A2P5D5U8_TREOI|nr:F-box domain containing protein [Trema orientale]
MATKGVKTNFRFKKYGISNTRGSPVVVDRLSNLPNPLIHHILSFVPTLEVVRMSILSKRWRRVWYSIPALHFCDIDHMGQFRFKSQPRKAFNKFVDKCLKQREVGFVFGFAIPYRILTSAALDNWLSFAIRRNVEELDLRAKPKFKKFVDYCLPETVLNARSLTVLKLESLTLDGSCSVNLPSLISLSLVDVKLHDEVLHNLLLGCPALNKFLLKKCAGLLNTIISSSTLKFSEIVEDFIHYRAIKVEGANLQSLIYDGFCDNICLSACKAIRNLSLLFSGLDDQSLEDLIFGLPLLECLTISASPYCLKHFRICGQHLRSIRLEKSYDDGLVKVTIDAPNLVSLCYKGDTKFGISMNAVRDNILSGHIIINDDVTDGKYDTNWYINLITFLSNINFSWKTTVSLHVYSEEALIFPENLRKICRSPWPNLKHMKIMTYRPSEKKADLKVSLYWVSPALETLVIEKETKGYF